MIMINTVAIYVWCLTPSITFQHFTLAGQNGQDQLQLQYLELKYLTDHLHAFHVRQVGLICHRYY